MELLDSEFMIFSAFIFKSSIYNAHQQYSQVYLKAGSPYGGFRNWGYLIGVLVARDATWGPFLGSPMFINPHIPDPWRIPKVDVRSS